MALPEGAVQNPITSFWTVTFSTYGSVCLEFFETVTFEKKKKEETTSFRKHELSDFRK